MASSGSSVITRSSGPLRVVLRHADNWGPAWFGLIFWGSVLFATAQRLWPDADRAVLLFVAAGTGLVAGLTARRRGYWL